jgi:co-chaperonin GroES (HSP10)
MAEKIKMLHPMPGQVIVKRDEVKTEKDLGGGKTLVTTVADYAEYQTRFNDRATVLSIGAHPFDSTGREVKLQYRHTETGEVLDVKAGDRVLISPNLGRHAKLSGGFEVDVLPYSGIVGVFEVGEEEEEETPAPVEESRIVTPEPSRIILV